MTGIRVAALAGVLGLAAMLAVAQETDGGMDHSAMDHGAMDGAMGAMMGAMDRMMTAMPGESVGSVDADFLVMMIPHHQAAIDMARVELESGTDPETRAMAERIVAAQEAEIAEMRAMLDRLGVPAP
jgi:uncharacterized protein (DUF305 family)